MTNPVTPPGLKSHIPHSLNRIDTSAAQIGQTFESPLRIQNSLHHVNTHTCPNRHHWRWHFCQGTALGLCLLEHFRPTYWRSENADRDAQPAVLATPLLSLKLIYSRSLKSAKETSELLPASHGAVDLYSEDSGPGKSFKDVLSRSDIVGVVIALPIPNQPEFIEAALKAGKHVLAEKPVGPDVESAKKLISWYREIAAEKKVTWAVAEQFRFLPKYVWAAEQARRLGKVIGFNFRVFQLCSQGVCYTTCKWRGENAD